MAASACSNLKVTKAFEPNRSEKTVAHDHPEFKDITKDPLMEDSYSA
jgi:hypothetical protein